MRHRFQCKQFVENACILSNTYTLLSTQSKLIDLEILKRGHFIKNLPSYTSYTIFFNFYYFIVCLDFSI